MLEHEEQEYGTRRYTPEWPTSLRRISWGAIIAGILVTLAVFITLQMLGAGIGGAAIDLTGRETTSPRSLGIGAAIWWLITGLISLFIGGWVAGRLGWLPNKVDRVLHGLTVWAGFYAVMFLLVTTALGALLGGGMSLLSSGISAAAEVAGAPQEQQAIGEQAQAQAGQMLEDLRARPEEARQTGEQAANITGATFIGLAVSMLLGALAAALGSLLATRPRVYVPPHEREHEGVATTEERTYASR